MQNPQGTKGTGPSSQCLVAIGFQWEKKGTGLKGQGLEYIWSAIHQAFSGLTRMHHVRITETKHIPILFATPPLPKESLFFLINVLCFQSWKS